MSDGTLELGAVEGDGIIGVTVADVKLNMRVGGDYDNDLIDGLFDAGVAALERMYGICIVRRNVKMVFVEFGDRLVLRRANNMVLGAINYFDAFGVEQHFELDGVRTEHDMTNFVSVKLRKGFSWPVHYGEFGEISVDYIAGWAAADDGFDKSIGQAIKLLVADWYKLKADTSETKQYAIGNGVKALMGGFRPI
ncbi:MAG: hypothetical protein COB24_08875 [Hyphomicrobiales bacterium]|nr:MAG: hypothetical protein COB24_08875 [Hyphomicrobiales bacterium]